MRPLLSSLALIRKSHFSSSAKQFIIIKAKVKMLPSFHLFIHPFFFFFYTRVYLQTSSAYYQLVAEIDAQAAAGEYLKLYKKEWWEIYNVEYFSVSEQSSSPAPVFLFNSKYICVIFVLNLLNKWVGVILHVIIIIILLPTGKWMSPLYWQEEPIPPPSSPISTHLLLVLLTCSSGSAVGDAAFRFNLIFFDTTFCDTQTETKQKYIFAHKDEEARLSEE